MAIWEAERRDSGMPQVGYRSIPIIRVCVPERTIIPGVYRHLTVITESTDFLAAQQRCRSNEPPPSLRQLLKERLRLVEDRRAKSFGEPAVDRHEKIAPTDTNYRTKSMSIWLEDKVALSRCFNGIAVLVSAS
jgi:hypothetical protein